ncbi:MAG: hypothetical protein AB7F09_08205 [Parvibaculaceae bacterium]
MNRKLGFALASLLAFSGEALAAGTVTLCAQDNQAPAGPGQVNLVGALSGGGRITFNCPPGTVMRMTRAHTVVVPTEIDGEGRMVFDGEGISAMFVPETGAAPLTLRNITLRRGALRESSEASLGTSFAGLVFGPGQLVLANAIVEATRSPFAVGSVQVAGGRFTGNSGTILKSNSVTIDGAQFIDNDAVPFSPVRQSSVPGVDGLATGMLARVSNALFTNNRQIAWKGRIEIKRSVFDRNGRGAANGGALWLQGDGLIEKSSFTGNQATHGGAIGLEQGVLAIRRGMFTGNQAQNSGGAIAIGIGRQGQPSPPQGSQLSLSYSKFERNSAAFGGAVFLAFRQSDPNRLSGRVNHFAGNTASASGGAIGSLDGTIHLRRAIFVGNQATVAGGAIDAGDGLRRDSTALGSSLVVRNAAPLGGGFRGSSLELVNATVADNGTAGVLLTRPVNGEQGQQPGRLRLKNSIVLNNAGGNCRGEAADAVIEDMGNNLQHPGADCGAGLPSADPQLDTFYVPWHVSPARNAGDNETCIRHDLVAGRDVYGDSRPEGERCTIGAVERDLESHTLVALRKKPFYDLERPLRDILSTLGIERYPQPDYYEK